MVPEKYGFTLINTTNNGIKEYRFAVCDGEFIELVRLDDIFSLDYFYKDTKMVVANRYRCNSDEDFEFLLFNGRVGYIFKPVKP